MKKTLFLMMLWCAAFNTAKAQTITWTGTNGANWSTPANWDSGFVPGSGADVIIPSGSTVVIGDANVKTLTVLGTVSLSLSGQLIFSGTCSFSANTTLTWTSGTLSGGGTLSNLGTINLTTASDKAITSATTLTNLGTINMTTSGDIAMSTSTINNAPSGVIDMQANAGNFTFFSGQGTINNAGLIKRTTTSGDAIISVILNNSGTISAQNGTLVVSNDNSTFTNGIYNTTAGATLEWNQTITCLGTLTGLINGTINWVGNIVVAPSTSATFNFTGPSGISWNNGTLRGGGTLLNQSVINLKTASDKALTGGTTLTNSGTINITSSGDLAMSASTINNLSTGIIDLKDDAGNFTFFSGQGTINNAGEIKRTTSTGVAIIGVILNNTGTINTLSGTLRISNADSTLTNGVYNVSAGATLEWEQSVTCIGTLTGILNGTLLWSGVVIVAPASTATFNFSGPSGISWNNGSLRGGGTLVNQSVINLGTASDKSITGGTTLTNTNTINIIASGDLAMSASTINNLPGGIIDLRADAGNFTFFSGQGTINNSGTVKKTTSTGTAIIAVILKSTGTINAESGILNLANDDNTLTNGTYNVTSGATLNWQQTITCLGTLTGAINGELNWQGNVSVAPASTAIFNFSGSQPVKWISGSLRGGGTLVNKSVLTLTTATDKSILGTTLNNEGSLNIASSGDLTFSNSTLNNLATGIINFSADSGNFGIASSSTHVLNNAGLVKKSAGIGSTVLGITINNSGVFDIQSGTLQMSGIYNNNATGITKGTGTIALPSGADFTNSGTFAPGGSPGKLTATGNYTSTVLTRLAVELNGLTQTTQYDHLAIQGSAVMNGVVTVTLGFAPNINDTFTIATTTGTITTFGLAATTATVYNGTNYVFNVTRTADNKNVVLTLVEKLLSNEAIAAIDKKITLAPNPASAVITLRNDSGWHLNEAIIMDFSGRVINTIDLDAMAADKEIALDRYASGQYLMKINSQSGSIVKRFTKM